MRSRLEARVWHLMEIMLPGWEWQIILTPKIPYQRANQCLSCHHNLGFSIVGTEYWCAQFPNPPSVDTCHASFVTRCRSARLWNPTGTRFRSRKILGRSKFLNRTWPIEDGDILLWWLLVIGCWHRIGVPLWFHVRNTAQFAEPTYWGGHVALLIEHAAFVHVHVGRREGRQPFGREV